MTTAPTSEIIIAGFHRSGTSVAAQLLHAAGLFVGDDLIGAMAYNPYGHYEDREVLTIHDQILRENGRNWQTDAPFVPMVGAWCWQAMERLVTERRLRYPLWGFKDPRVCLFLPLWKHLMPSCRVLICFRPVGDCCSASRRHARELFTKSGPAEVHRRFFTEPDLVRMWLVHNRALLSFAERYPEDVLAISFASLLAGLPLTRLLREVWGAPLQEVPTFSALDPLATQRRPTRQPLADPELIAPLDETWDRLCRLERDSLGDLVRRR